MGKVLKHEMDEGQQFGAQLHFLVCPQPDWAWCSVEGCAMMHNMLLLQWAWTSFHYQCNETNKELQAIYE